MERQEIFIVMESGETQMIFDTLKEAIEFAERETHTENIEIESWYYERGWKFNTNYIPKAITKYEWQDEKTRLNESSIFN